jgi:AcrR family transcriptional regulator
VTESTPKRGRPRREAASSDIMSAALETIAELGFSSATVEAVAARAGVARNTIYLRWSSKEALFADAIEQLTLVPTTTEVSAVDDGDTFEWLVRQARATRDSLSHPTVAKIIPALVGELQRNERLANAWVDRVVRPRQQAITARLVRAQESGQLRPDVDAWLISDLLLAPFFLHIVSPFGHPAVPNDYPESLVRAIWYGIDPTHR